MKTVQAKIIKDIITKLEPDNPAEKAYFFEHFHRYLKTLEFIPAEKLKNSTVVDAGCVPGHLALACKLLGAAKVVGLDYDPDRFGFRQKLEKQGIAVYKCRLGEDKIPLPDATGDFVIFTEVIEHLPCVPKAVLAEFWRILKPGGRLIITTPNVKNLANILRTLFGKSVSPNSAWVAAKPEQYHHHEYELNELAAAVSAAGFKIKKTAFIAGTEAAILKSRFETKIPRLISLTYALFAAILPRWRSYLFASAEKM